MNEYLEFVLETAKEVFTREDITPETRFKEDLDAASLSIAQLGNKIEDEYDCDVPYMVLKRKQTIQEVADYVEELVEE